MNAEHPNNLKHGRMPVDPEEDDILNGIDFDKVFRVFRQSIPYMIFFVILINVITLFYLRYTKPIYESDSILKLDIKSESNIVGIQNPMDQEVKGLSGEIEILRSRLFMREVVNAIKMDVSYYHPGRSHWFTSLVDERYNNSPFSVKHELKNAGLYNIPIELTILDANRYELKYYGRGQKIRIEGTFGVKLDNEDFIFLIEKAAHFDQHKELVDYYFIINSDEALISYLINNVLVEPINFNANTIRISLKDPNPTKAKSLIAAIDTIYLDFTKAAKNLAVDQKIAFVDRQMVETAKEIEEFESYFEEFTIENRTTDLSADLSRSIMLLHSLDSQRYNLRKRWTEVSLLSKQLNSGEVINISPFAVLGMPGIIQNAVGEYNTKLSEREQKAQTYKEHTLVIKKLDNQLLSFRHTAAEYLLEYQKILQNEMDALNARQDRIEKSFVELPSMGTKYNKHKRIYSLKEEYYFSLISTKIELEIGKAGTVTNFVILSPASISSTPVHPRKLLIQMIGFAISLVFCLVFMAVKYLLHNKISSHKELERLVHAPILGLVPYYRESKLAHTSLVINNNPKSAISEALRSIRTNMEFITKGGEKKIISVTSTVSGEGKTFIVTNLGAILAYSKLKVVVVDLDMRKPKVHLAFGGELSGKGVSTILIDRNTVEETICETAVEHLYYIPAGPTPPNPSELLIGDTFDKMLDELKSKFDVVILDTPPVGLVTDGILAMKKSNLPIYIIRANYSKKAYLKSVHGLIFNHNFSNLSIIFNSVRTNKNQGYGYGYGEGYSHGYYTEEKKPTKLSYLARLFTKN